MDSQTFIGVQHTLHTVAFALIVVGICALFPRIQYRAQLARLPTIGDKAFGEKQRKAYLQSAKAMYNDGYKMFKDSVFRIVAADGEDVIVITPQFLPELRKLPDSVLSFPKAIEKTMEVRYTQLQPDTPIIYHTIKSDLNPGLVRLNSVIYAEVERALREELPECEDWTAVPIYMSLAKMVAKISGRIFVGPDLCRNKDYLDSAVNYTMDVMGAHHAIKQVRPSLRPWLAPRLPEVQQLRNREMAAMEYLEPVVQERTDAEANDPNWEKPDDMLQWLMNKRNVFGIKSTAALAKLQLGLTFAAIHTTTLTLTNILYSLAVTPEYFEPLREEIRTAMAENGGTITTRALQQMVKVDSYMKEVIRFYPTGFTSFNRKVLKGFTLSNGQYIPKGCLIETPSYAVYQDSFPDGDTFDGFRHYKLRQGGTAADHARNQFVTTNEKNLNFGYGAHACPGRFFAANEIKMLLARLVLDFDIKNADGSATRYPNIEQGRQIAPDARKLLSLKRIEV